MRTAEEAIAAFAGWDGTAEYPPGSNRNWITDWYGMGPVAWCAMACSRALIEAGFGTPSGIEVPGVRTTSARGWAYCPYVEDDFRAAGRWHDEPEPGDLVLFDWDGDGWSDHVGMVATVEADGSITAWEGNTDEGVVRLKRRSPAYVRGYARPPYLTVTPEPQPQPSQEAASMVIFDGPPEVGGGIYTSDGDRAWGVPSEAWLRAFFFSGAFRHVGTIERQAFFELRDRDGQARNPGVGLAELEAEGVLSVAGTECRSVAEVLAASADPAGRRE